jgi:hypothetical protein
VARTLVFCARTWRASIPRQIKPALYSIAAEARLLSATIPGGLLETINQLLLRANSKAPRFVTESGSSVSAAAARARSGVTCLPTR